MDEMDCRNRSDSILMRLLRSAMDNAYEKVQSNDGPLDCLHERFKFYELAIIQIKGCYGLIQEEIDSCIPEISRENMLVDLIELQDHFQARLQEMKSSINEKDYEIIERSKNEFKLKHALASKERELRCLRANIEIERAKSESFHDFIYNFQVNNGDDQAKEGEICELKNSIDQQVLNIKQKLEDERARKSASSASEIDAEILNESYEDNFYEELCVRPEGPEQNIVIEQMSSDIDILEGTLKIAFKRMQSAEVRPLEEQVKWMIERDTSTTVIKGFIIDLKQNFEVSSGLPIAHMSEWVEEMTRLRAEFENLISRNDSMEKRGQSNDHIPAISRRTSSEPLPYFDYMEESVEENLAAENSHYVAKLMQNHESFIPRQQRKSHGPNKGLGRRRYSSAEREDESKFTERRIRDVVEKLDNVTKLKDKMCKKIPASSKHEKMNKGKSCRCCDKELSGERDKFEEEKCASELQALVVEDTYIIIFKGLLEKFNLELCTYESESYIRDAIFFTVYREAIKKFTTIYDLALEEHQHYCLQNRLREDIYTIFTREIVNEFEKCMESHVNESLVIEEVYRIVYEEVIRYIRNEAYFEKSQHQDLPDIVESSVKEDINTLLLRGIVEDLKMEIEAYEIRNSIRDNIYQFMIIGSAKEALNQCHCSQVSTLSNCPELNKYLMPRANINIKEENSQREEGDQCGTVDSSSGDETTSSLVSKNLESSMHQLSTSKEPLKYPQCTLGIEIGDSEKENSQMNLDLEVLHENEKSLAKAETIQSVLHSSSDIVLSPLMRFQKLLLDFENMVEQKLQTIDLRLEKLKQKISLIFQAATLVRKSNLLYKEAFVRRCCNLQLAENEVDLLGDQVDVLLGLLHNIYLILNQYSPILSRHFEVSGILKLIDEKVNGIDAHAAEL